MGERTSRGVGNLAGREVRGFLIDLDGVLYVGDGAIPGSIEAVAALRSRGYPFRFLTNTTTKTPGDLAEKLLFMGFEIEESEIITTPTLAARYLRDLGDISVHLVVDEAIVCEFGGFKLNHENPDYIVVGDIGRSWDYELMSNLFEMMMGGSRLLALHKGRFWLAEDGMRLDIGAFVAGLEYAAGIEAVAIGKPSRDFFALALEDLGLGAGVTAMIGDDIYNDIGGARDVGLITVLTKTGKYNEEFVKGSGIEPDITIESLAAMLQLL